jgi:hypothetical protein
MNYDKLIYNTRPVKFNDYINNKYDIVHAELYEDALQRFLDSHIYETIMGVNLYNILNVFNNFLTEFNDDKIDDFVMYVQSQYTEDGFHIFDEEEIDNILNGDVQDHKTYFNRLVKYILESDDTINIRNAFDELDMNQESQENYLKYILFNMIVLLYSVKSNLQSKDIGQISDISDFIIKYKNSIYVINEEETDFIASEQDIDNDEFVFIYEDTIKNDYHIGYNKEGKWIIDINKDIQIDSNIYDYLSVLITSTNDNLKSIMLRNLLDDFLSTHRIVEIQNEEYYKASKIIIYNKYFPFNKRIVDLTPYWNNYQFYNNKNIEDIKVTEENKNDSYITDIDYIHGKVKMYSKINDMSYDVDFDYVKNNTEIDDSILRNTFTYKLNKL